jgi:pimeloyl-ACP methyl ester carboxylesterase
VKPLFEPHFTVFAIARRGRGATEATSGHLLEDERDDVAELIRRIGAPVALVGHSYGALVALSAATRRWLKPESGTSSRRRSSPTSLPCRATFSPTFGHLPTGRRSSPTPASLGDLRALARHRFDPERFSALTMPVLLQTGTESPPDIYVTDALAAVLPDAAIGPLKRQAHEGMTTAPDQYAEAGPPLRLRVRPAYRERRSRFQHSCGAPAARPHETFRQPGCLTLE